MNLKIRRKTLFLYFVLFCSCFNDILRIPGTGITFYRVLLPAALVYCVMLKKKEVIKIIYLYIIFEMISFFQSIIFVQSNDLGIIFSTNRFFMYSFYYFSIFCIFIIINTLYSVEKEAFIFNFFKVYSLLFFIILGIFACYAIFGFVYVSDLGIFGNVNNYATKIAAFFPYLIISGMQKKNKFKFILAGVVLYLMLINDCKIALIGIIIELFLFIVLARKSKELHYGKWITFIGIFIIIFFGYYILNYNITINGYNLTYMVPNFISGIIRRSSDINLGHSGNFRLNVILNGFEWIEKTHLLGIGIGNAGILMRRIMIFEGRLLNQSAISLHAYIIEFLLECGFIAILFIITIWREIIITYRRRINNLQTIYLITFLSMWVWIFQPSEMITEYFTIGFLYGLFLINKNNLNYKQKYIIVKR